MGNNASCCHKETKNGAIEVVEAKAVDLQVREASKESHPGTQARLSVPCQQVRRRSEILKEGALSLPGQDSEVGSHRDSVASGHTIGPHREKSRSAILRTTVLRVDTAIMRGGGVMCILDSVPQNMSAIELLKGHKYRDQVPFLGLCFSCLDVIPSIGAGFQDFFNFYPRSLGK